MSGAEPELETWTRQKAISRLRTALRKLTDDEHSICEVAAERGIFCHGFRRWSDSEFDRRFQGTLGRSTHLSREQMEDLANVWQLAEQIRRQVGFACDAQRGDSGGCRGWDEFSDADLSRHCGEILGRRVRVLREDFPGSGAQEERPDEPAAPGRREGRRDPGPRD